MKLLGKAISGTCGARTYSVGGAGVTARQKTCPVNKNSLAQARRRGLFAAAGAAFKALTALQREELHARALAASETDVFGKKITLSDYAYFMREWMRGIRPAPQEDLSVIALNEFRRLTWIQGRIQPSVFWYESTDGQLSDTIKSSGNELIGNYKIETTLNELFDVETLTYQGQSQIVFGSSQILNRTVKTVRFTDSLGRVFTF